MNLTDPQKQAVAQWIASGAKLSEIQNRLSTEFGLRLTYMEVRFIVDDLKLMPKDPEPKKTAEPADKKAEPEPVPAADVAEALPSELPELGGKLSITVDHVARPGTMVSGSVKFTDGVTATWYMDEMGRLGLSASQKGYRPSATDVQAFQLELQKELQKLGYG